jgi:hypothetical protein
MGALVLRELKSISYRVAEVATSRLIRDLDDVVVDGSLRFWSSTSMAIRDALLKGGGRVSRVSSA